MHKPTFMSAYRFPRLFIGFESTTARRCRVSLVSSPSSLIQSSPKYINSLVLEREKERIQTLLGDFFLLSTVYLPSLVLFCFFGFLMAKWEGPTWGCSQLNEELNVTSVIWEMNVKILWALLPKGNDGWVMSVINTKMTFNGWKTLTWNVLSYLSHSNYVECDQ